MTKDVGREPVPQPDRELVAQIQEALAQPDRALRTLGVLEARWDRPELVAATRAVIGAPVFRVLDAGPVGLVTGSGGVIHRLPNISTVAAIVASCADGVVVAKPGSARSRTKLVGPAGLAAMLEIKVVSSEGELREQFDKHSFAVIASDVMYPWLQVPELQMLPFLVEAIGLTSLQPCTADWKVNGVIDNDPGLHAERCRSGHIERCMIVHGRTDSAEFVIDDVSTAGTTEIQVVNRAEATCVSLTVEPEDLGLRRSHGSELVVPAGAAPQDIVVSILDGSAPRAWIDLCAFASGVILFHATAAASLREGVKYAQELLESGAAAAKLKQLRGC